MQITDVRVTLNKVNGDHKGPKFLAYCSVTFDYQLTIHDFKIIENSGGIIFVAMPAKRVMDKCRGCLTKNIIEAKFCHNCKSSLNFAPKLKNGKPQVYIEVVHPITKEYWKELNEVIIQSYKEKLAEEV